MIKAVIFDLDGTLLDTIEDLANACNYALESSGFEIHEIVKYKQFVGNGRYNLIKTILPENHRDDQTIDKTLMLFDEYYSKHMIDMTKPYDGIMELLEWLRKREIKIAVVSNKPHEFTIEVVKNYFEDKINITFGQRKNYPTKPNPKSLYEVMERLNVKKEECIYVGDSDVDMITARNANVKSVGVIWGFRGKGELEEAGADYLIKNTKELIDIINNEIY